MSKSVSSEAGAAAMRPVPLAGDLWRREGRATLRLATPLVLAQLAHIGIGTTDVLMMGWLGPEALAAGALGVNFLFPLYLFGLGVATAVAPMAAQALGARQYRGVRRTVRQGFWVTFLVAALLTLLIWNAEPILLLLGQAEDSVKLAMGYLRAAVWSLVPGLWIIVLRSFVSAHSRPRSVLVVTLLGVGVNAFGNYTLMFGHFGFPALGLVGAGISSSLVNAFMFLALMGFVLRDRKFRRYALLVRFWRSDWPRFFEIVRIGIPIGLTILAESGMFAAAAFLMGLLGTTELAAHAIALQCAAVAFMVPLGICHATTVRVGLAVGIGDRAGVGRAGWTSLALGCAFMLASALALWLLPWQLVGLFLDIDAADQMAVASLAVSFLGVAALFQLFDGAQVIVTGALRGLKDTRIPLLYAVVAYWPIGFGTSVLLGFQLGLGGLGIWIGLAFGLATLSALGTWRFHRRERLPWAQSPPGLAET